MHEAAFASSLLRIVLEEAGKHETAGLRLRVTGIELETGALSCLEAHTLKGCFELLAEGTAAENSLLTVRARPLSGYCPACGQQVRAGGRSFSCPLCAGGSVAWEGGHEMKITAITVTPFPGTAPGEAKAGGSTGRRQGPEGRGLKP
ncbi:MAG: hydrogenase maturation nickel metallochaperone HypA [Desulfovibrio sp.]|jgi:hydrogenase nickel incorporation protein HypA/HybF|nr:hydrogenase maturation nickel metallochaperone HypA [Desulfovibrio sp.]